MRARMNTTHWYLLLALGGVAACSGTPDTGDGDGTGSGAGGDLVGDTGGDPASGGSTISSGGALQNSGGSGDVASGGSSPGSSGGADGANSGGDSSGSGGSSSDGSGGALVEEGPPAAPEGTIPNDEYPSNVAGPTKNNWRDGLISPTLESEHHNQPSIINGYLQLTGNSMFSMYDISNPREPKLLSTKRSPNDDPRREAEGHQVSYAKHGNKIYSVTIQGNGVDIWEITDVRNPKHLKEVRISGINFGDFTAAVWGVFWQGNTIFVGGTDTGVHVIDAQDPANATLVGRLANVGGVNAGPLFAVGNTLVVTTPKSNKGIATIDISNPKSPVLLDSIPPAEAGEDSYIGWFYGKHAYLLNPIRVYDVLSNPASISKVNGNRPGGYFEYMSFQDGMMFAGRIRPEPGATKIDVRDIGNFKFVKDIYGRRDLKENDDQFTIAVGNLLILSDDQLSPETNKYAGTVIAVHDTKPDTTPPRVDTIIPKDGTTGQALSSRIGISFTDNVELATVDSRSFIVRKQGGAVVAGNFGLSMSVLNFEPNEPLEPNTTYEVVLPAGGVKDYVGNGIAEEFRSTFTTRGQ